MTPPLLLVAAALTLGQAPASFPAAKHGGGELAYVQGVPVLTVRGSPAEIGEQFGVLAVKNAPDLTGLHQRFLKDAKLDETYPALQLMARRLKANFPERYRVEMEAAAKASGRELDLLLFANTVADLSSGMGCSTLIVENDRSATGSPLFGRNFDWLPTKGLTEHTLVVVYKPEKGHAFAAVTFTPITGVISGMNDAGLAVTINEIHLKQSADKAGFDWRGTPLLSLYRRVLEECATVAEAEKLVRATPRTTSACMTICDVTGGAVFELTPRTVQVRSAANGVCCCTNHFCSDGLCVEKVAAKCWRLPKLEAVQRADGKLGVADVYAALDGVHQTAATLQSMVFEPKERRLHLKHGEGPATKRDAVVLELGKMFR